MSSTVSYVGCSPCCGGSIDTICCSGVPIYLRASFVGIGGSCPCVSGLPQPKFNLTYQDGSSPATWIGSGVVCATGFSLTFLEDPTFCFVTTLAWCGSTGDNPGVFSYHCGGAGSGFHYQINYGFSNTCCIGSFTIRLDG